MLGVKIVINRALSKNFLCMVLVTFGAGLWYCPVEANPNRRPVSFVGSPQPTNQPFGDFLGSANSLSETVPQNHLQVPQSDIIHLMESTGQVRVPERFSPYVVTTASQARQVLPPNRDLAPSLQSFMERLQQEREAALAHTQDDPVAVALQNDKDAIPGEEGDDVDVLEALLADAGEVDAGASSVPVRRSNVSELARIAESEAVFPRPHMEKVSLERLMLFFPVESPANLEVQETGILVPVNLPAAQFSRPGGTSLRSSATINPAP